MDEIDVGGLRITYERAGHGPPLVLLHGYVGDGPVTWRHQLDRLSDEFTVVAWDAPGAGGSSDPPELLGMAGFADCLASFVERLGLGPTHFVGLSFGGALALEVARRHPGLASSLVLVSGYAGWAGSLGADLAEQRLRQALMLSERSPQDLVDALLPSMFSASTPDEDVDAFATSMREFHPIGFRAMARAAAEDLRDALPGIAVPTLLICGDRDERAPMYVAESLLASISTATLTVFPGVGHISNIEAPEAFNRELRAFLTSLSSDGRDRGQR